MNWYKVTGTIKRVYIDNLSVTSKVSKSAYAPDDDAAIRATIELERAKESSRPQTFWVGEVFVREMTETDILATMPDLAPRLPGF